MDMQVRKQKMQELLEGLRSLRRSVVVKGVRSSHAMPRITPSQWAVLELVVSRSETTIKEVAQVLGVTSSAATQLVDGLVESGYVLRTTHTKDRRQIVLSLSKKSTQAVEKIKKEALKKFLTIFAVLNDKEFEQYCMLNAKIVKGLLHTSDSSLNHHA